MHSHTSAAEPWSRPLQEHASNLPPRRIIDSCALFVMFYFITEKTFERGADAKKPFQSFQSVGLCCHVSKC